MKYSSRIFLWGPIALLLILALTASARWWSVASDLSKRLDRMNGAHPVPGVTLRFASKTIGGFPFNVDAVLHDLEITVAGPRGPIAWKSENFAAHALTYGRAQWLLEAAGKQHLGWTTKDGKHHGLAFDIASLHASVIYDGDALSRFDLDLVGFNSPALDVARLQFHIRHNGAQIDVVGDVDSMRLSPPLRGVCGEEIGRVRFQGDLSNSAAFDSARSGRVTWQSGFDNWRAQGGRLYLAQGEFACSESNAFVQGQLGLDSAKRLRGLLTAQIAGFDKLREAVSHRAGAGTFIVSLLSQPQDPNPAHEGRVTVRAAFRDGMTWLGNTPVGINDPLY
jgi:hypothetical protein